MMQGETGKKAYHNGHCGLKGGEIGHGGQMSRLHDLDVLMCKVQDKMNLTQQIV